MAFAKFYSEKLLDIPNLVHIEFLKKTGGVTFVGNNLREPDLVGQSLDGNWHVVEAKGISGSEAHLRGKINKAKLQVQQVASIHDVAPTTRTACATCIGANRIFTILNDPSAEDSKNIDINREKFFDAYYAPFLLAEKYFDRMPSREILDGVEVDFFDLERASRKLRIGIISEVSNQLLDRKFDFSQDINLRLREYSSADRRGDRYSIGLDGFVVGYSDG